jgi:hypothetical protein
LTGEDGLGYLQKYEKYAEKTSSWLAESIIKTGGNYPVVNVMANFYKQEGPTNQL